MPRTKETDASEFVAQEKPVDFPTDAEVPTKPRRARTARADDSVLDDPVPEGRLDGVRFMNEMVTVLLHDSTDPNAEPIPSVSVNGVNQFFIRNRPQTVKRKFVAALARAKPTAFSQHIHVEQATGNVVQRMNPRTALKYPFSVINDPNPRGAAWLQSILGQI